MNGFKYLRAHAEAFRREDPACYLSPGGVAYFCRDCRFWREDERLLECNALTILKRLLAKGIISPEDVLHAVEDD